MVEVERREFILGMGAACITPVLLQGCIFAFMRLSIGRGAAAALGRAMRAGRTGAALSLGRGVSAAGRMAATRLSTLPPTQIIGRSGKLIAETRSTSNGLAVHADGSIVFQSVEHSYGYRHYDFDGPVGRSYRRSKGVTEHHDETGTIVAVDRINTTSRVIEHYDEKRVLIGRTRININNANLDVITDDRAVQQIDAYTRLLGLHCPDTKRAYDELQEAQRLCAKNEGDECAKVTLKNSRYDNLRRQCLEQDYNESL